ncbi:hypothetical protein EI94DRAFT_1704324 [Lactarius quietus]|nr:hypothetical protein EI94DRAFT_1704324 [Lactarius quietus]
MFCVHWKFKNGNSTAALPCLIHGSPGPKAHQLRPATRITHQKPCHDVPQGDETPKLRAAARLRPSALTTHDAQDSSLRARSASVSAEGASGISGESKGGDSEPQRVLIHGPSGSILRAGSKTVSLSGGLFSGKGVKGFVIWITCRPGIPLSLKSKLVDDDVWCIPLTDDPFLLYPMQGRLAELAFGEAICCGEQGTRRRKGFSLGGKIGYPETGPRGMPPSGFIGDQGETEAVLETCEKEVLGGGWASRRLFIDARERNGMKTLRE